MQGVTERELVISLPDRRSHGNKESTGEYKNVSDIPFRDGENICQPGLSGLRAVQTGVQRGAGKEPEPSRRPDVLHVSPGISYRCGHLMSCGSVDQSFKVQITGMKTGERVQPGYLAQVIGSYVRTMSARVHVEELDTAPGHDPRLDVINQLCAIRDHDPALDCWDQVAVENVIAVLDKLVKRGEVDRI